MRGFLTCLAFLMLLPGVPASAQEAAPQPGEWAVTIPTNTRAPSDITVSNECRKTHSFDLLPENVPYLQFSRAQIKVRGGQVDVVPVRFDTTGLAPGLHRGQVTIVCRTCPKERNCRQDRDVLRVALTVTARAAAPAAAAPNAAAPAAAATADDPCADLATNCDELRRAAAQRQAEADAARAAAERERGPAERAGKAADEAEKAADQAEQAAEDDPSDYRARVNDQEYSSADIAYLEVLRAQNNAALAAGEITTAEHQNRARELTAKKAREERLANKERLAQEAKAAREKADAARKAADLAQAAADAAQKRADEAQGAADRARQALEDCEEKVRDECKKRQQAREEARLAGEKERQAEAAAAQTRADEKKREEQAAANRREQREHVEYLIDNIKTLGLIDSEGMAKVPSIWQWLPDILETPVATLLEQQSGTPIPTDTLKALGGLYGLIGKLLDPCTALGKRKTVERLETMTNPKTGRKYTFDEAFKKTEEMCRLMRKLKSKLEALEKAQQKSR